MSPQSMMATAIDQFTRLDTRDQAKVLKRVGEDTETADRMLGALRGNYPDRWQALATLMGYTPDTSGGGQDNVPRTSSLYEPEAVAA